MDWTKEEVAFIVEDYFNMLKLELNQQQYNKSAYRRALLPFLNDRSEGAIEFKRQNISAVLIELGLPFIKGYVPLSNFQESVKAEVSKYLVDRGFELEQSFVSFADGTTEKPRITIYDDVLRDGPVPSEFAESQPLYRPLKINYLEREQSNRDLGQKGEEFVIDYERWRLLKAGKANFADRIEWVSKEIGDGLGYDILSRNINGSDRFIEVKTTKLSKETPIYLSRTELSFASKEEKNFYLYRVFNFDTKPKIFIKNGDYEHFCKLVPQSFKGYF